MALGGRGSGLIHTRETCVQIKMNTSGINLLLACPHSRPAAAQLPHRLSARATDDATFWPRRVLVGRRRRLSKRPLAFLRLEIWADAQREAELGEELLRGQLARVEAHSLAARLLEELALLHNQPANLAVGATVERRRADQETKSVRSHDSRQRRRVEPRAQLPARLEVAHPKRQPGAHPLHAVSQPLRVRAYAEKAPTKLGKDPASR
mmetsp:Transcript_31741/g.101505  ORF Transcript_31741/g.101505 Transcript_31741/m.101505 type:complete len:208 (-) Transcript_31741:863-1486(-)